MVLNMMDNLRKFCEENNIECTVERNLDELDRIRMIHRPSGNSFCKLYWNLDDFAIESTIRSAKEIFNLVDVASLYPKFYMSPEWVETRMSKLSKRWIDAEMRAKRPEITKVIFNDPATIVFWSDSNKTVVKAENEVFDPEKGLAMAIAKKFLGNNKNKSDYYDVFKEWLPEDRTVEEKAITYLTPGQLAARIGYTADTIRKQCAAGMHPGAKKVIGRWMIPWEEK